MLTFKDTIIHQFPNGKWGFVGRVPVALGYQRPDGKPVTHKDAEACAGSGPRIAGLAPRVFATREEAEDALRGFQTALLEAKYAARGSE